MGSFIEEADVNVLGQVGRHDFATRHIGQHLGDSLTVSILNLLLHDLGRQIELLGEFLGSLAVRRLKADLTHIYCPVFVNRARHNCTIRNSQGIRNALR